MVAAIYVGVTLAADTLALFAIMVAPAAISAAYPTRQTYKPISVASLDLHTSAPSTPKEAKTAPIQV
jgi:hypothetical protein